MIAVPFFAALAILCCASADSVSTSVLLPDGLFYPSPTPQDFVGEVTVTSSATYYTLNCALASNFANLGEDCCSDNSYTFSESSANTQYILPE